jgi:uncharacterized damage-inducible protein DinB
MNEIFIENFICYSSDENIGEFTVNRIPHDWMIEGLEWSHKILGLTLAGVSQQQAQTIKDGPDGWTVLEIMCHLRDYQEIFFGRIKQILEEYKPTFKTYDEKARMALVVENDYANQNLRNVYDDYGSTRLELIKILSSLEDEQWERLGNFPGLGEVDISVPIYHTMFHDSIHIEQIGRILRQ